MENLTPNRITDEVQPPQTQHKLKPNATVGVTGTIQAPCTRSGSNGTSPPNYSRETAHWDLPERRVIDEIRENDGFVCEAILALYKRQTVFERRHSVTLRKNGMGFSVADAGVFSELARHVMKTGNLDPVELAICRAPMRNGMPRLAKYRKQLVEILFVAFGNQEAA